MLLRSLGIALSSLLLIASPVNADWEFTKWGMSIKELKRVSPIKIIDGGTICKSEDKQKEGLRSLWTGYGTTFDICFIFVNQKLSRIWLFSREETDLLPLLTEKYGESNIVYKSLYVSERLGRTTKSNHVFWEYNGEQIIFSRDERIGRDEKSEEVEETITLSPIPE